MIGKREEIQLIAEGSMREKDHKGIWDIAPRVGKSKILINSIREKSDWNIVISSPFEAIRDNWKAEFKKWDLGFEPMSICSRSLSKAPKDADLYVIDEIQTLSRHQMEVIMSKKPKRILGLTGTLADKTMLELFTYLYVKPEFRYSIEQAISDGIIANFDVYIILTKLNNFEKNVLTGGDKPFMTTERAYYDYLSVKFEEFKEKELEKPHLAAVKMRYAGLRSRFLYSAKSKFDIAKQIVDQQNRTIVFTGLSNVADAISPDSYHSKNKKTKNLEKFINGGINKLSVVEMVNMGITIPDLKSAVIHQLKSDSEMSWQKILRVCNLEDDKTAEIFITVADDTVDLGWTLKALKGINLNRVAFIYEEDFLRDGIMGKRQEKFIDLLSLQ